MSYVARSDVPRVLARERDLAVARCAAAEPPSFTIRSGDPLVIFYVCTCNALLERGWHIRDAALVLAVALVSREVGPHTARNAARVLVLDEYRGKITA